MRLSNKVLVTLGVLWTIFLAVSYLTAEEFLLESYLRLEKTQVNINVDRVNQALNQVSYALSTFTVDWAHWNDAYEYINGTNPQFVPNNLDYATLINSNINLLIYLNKQGQILVGVPFNIDQKQQVAYPAGLEKYIYTGSLLENQPNIKSNIRGLILLPSGIMLVAAAGTSYTDLSKPANGVLITGRYFSKELLQKIANATSLSLTLYLPDQIAKNPKFGLIYKEMILKEDNALSRENEHTMYGYALLYDIYHKPIGMLRIDMPRSIYITGKKTIHFYLLTFIASGILLAAIIWYLLKILILNRLEFLNKQIKDISGKKDYARHILMKEQDELASVASEFNHLMDTINASHQQLKKQVKEITQSEKELETINTKLVLEIHERKQMQQKVDALHKKLILAARRAGMADIASGVLHNVGNILNNVTTSVGITKEMIENSRIKKLNDLVKLLDDHKNTIVDFLTNDPRGARVVEYIGLLSSSLAEEKAQMHNEINNLDRYIAHIKEVVTMQQSMSSVIGMVENLKISDVVEDALMLNKSTFGNMDIKIVTDYQFNDIVSLDRVKLLHVIVNLIKNSIESLLTTKRLDKSILIRVLKKDDNIFTIEVADNGEGISEENITNVFAYGFTTKDTGNGIGLHTSASFIQEMGGKLYAKSEGIGSGAVFIVELPIHSLQDAQALPS